MSVEAWVAISLLIPTVVIAVLQSRQAKRQRVRDFELAYIQRYWQIYDRLALLIPERSRVECSTPLDDAQYSACVSYIDLCEDELDVRAAGWVSDSTWKLWTASIEDVFNDEILASVWKEVSSSSGRYSRLRAAKRQPHTDKLKDPCEVPRAAKWLRGLTGQY